MTISSIDNCICVNGHSLLSKFSMSFVISSLEILKTTHRLPQSNCECHHGPVQCAENVGTYSVWSEVARI